MPLIGITGDSSYQTYRGNYDDVPNQVDFGDLTNIYPQLVYASTPQKIEGINAKVEIKIISGDAKIFVYYDEDNFIFEESSYYQYLDLSTTSAFIKPGANIILFIEAVPEGGEITESLFNQIYSNNILIGRSDFSWTVTTSAVPSVSGLQFTTVIDAPLNSQVISNSATISNLLTDISYTARIISDEGRLSVNSGPNVISSSVVNGDNIQLILPTTASTQLTSKQVSISVSAANGAGIAQTTWTVVTERINAAAGLSFTSFTDVGFGTSVLSGPYTVSGLTSNTTYTGEIVGDTGFFKVNNGPNIKKSTVTNGNIITLFLPQTSLQELTNTPVSFRIFQSLDVGDTSATWEVITKEKNKNVVFTPTDFTDLTDVELNTFYTSGDLTISGLDVNATLPVTTTNADYKVVRNGVTIKDYSAADVEVANNDKISLRIKSSTQTFTEVSTSLTIGFTTIDWKVKTKPATPVFTPIDFTDITGATRNTSYESNALVVSNLTDGVSYSPSLSAGEYRVRRGGVVVKDYTASAIDIKNGDSINLRSTSSGSYSTTVTNTLTLGPSSVTWNITTEGTPPPPPPAPSTSPSDFTDRTGAELDTLYTSNTLTISTQLPTTISVFNASYNIFRDGVNVGSPVSILNGDRISLSMRSSSLYSRTVSSSITLSNSSGNRSINWAITTKNVPILTGIVFVSHYVSDGGLGNPNEFLSYSGAPISSIFAIVSGLSRYYVLNFTNDITSFGQSDISFSLFGAGGGSQPTLRIKSLVRNSARTYTLRFERFDPTVGSYQENFCSSWSATVQYQ